MAQPRTTSKKRSEKATAKPAAKKKKAADVVVQEPSDHERLEAEVRLHQIEVAAAMEAARLEVALSDLRRELVREAEEARTACKAAVAEMEKAIAERKQAQGEIETHRHQIDVTQADLAKARQELEALRQNGDNAREEHKRAEQAQAELKEERQAAGSALDHAHKQLADLNNAHRRTLDQLAEARARVDKAEKRAETEDPRIGTLEAQLAQTRATLAAETQRADDARNDIVHLKGELREIKSQDARERLVLRKNEERPAPVTAPAPVEAAPQGPQEVEPMSARELARERAKEVAREKARSNARFLTPEAGVADDPPTRPMGRPTITQEPETPETPAPVPTANGDVAVQVSMSGEDSLSLKATTKSTFIPQIGKVSGPQPLPPGAKPQISIKWVDGETELELPRGAVGSTDIFQKGRRRWALVAAALCAVAVAAALAWPYLVPEVSDVVQPAESAVEQEAPQPEATAEPETDGTR